MLNKKVTIFSCLAILAIVEAKPTTPKPAASSSEPTTTDKPDDEPATIISSEFEYDPINGNFSYRLVYKRYKIILILAPFLYFANLNKIAFKVCAYVL